MTVAAGLRRQRVTVQQAGPSVPDGDGGYTTQWTDAVPPSWMVQITSASAVDLERVKAGTIVAEAARVIHGPYRPDLTTTSRLLYDGRTLNVVSVVDLNERKVELTVLCAEVMS